MLYVNNNLLDELFYDELLSSGNYLKDNVDRGDHIFSGFSDFVESLFLLLYKIHIRVLPTSEPDILYNIFTEYLRKPEIKFIRLRTVSSKKDSYIALKLLMENFFESVSKKNVVEKLIQDFEELSNINEELSNIYEAIDSSNLDSILTEREIEKLKDITKSNDIEQDSKVKDYLKDLYSYLNNDKEDTKSEKQKNDFSNITNSMDEKEPDLSSFIDTAHDFSLEDTEEPEESENENSENEISVLKDEKVEQIEGAIKKDLEDRFSSVITKTSIKEGNSDDIVETFINEIDDSEKEDQIMLSNSGDISGDPVFSQTYGISSELEEKIRSKEGDWNSSNSNPKPFDFTDDFDINELSPTGKNTRDFISHKSLENISKKIDEFNDSIKTIGIKPETLNALSFEEVIKLHNRFTDKRFIDFVNKIGRGKKEARKLQGKKTKAQVKPVDKIKKSDNIEYLIDDEFINLSLDIPAFENDFYDRLLHSELLTTSFIDKKDKTKGPIILCYDGSGSMDGAKLRETRAQILSILEIAKIQKRKLILIQFASKSEPLFIKELNPISITAKDVLDVLDTFICGGTDFVNPLEKALEYIRMDKHRKSDILFITDGLSDIPNSFIEKFKDAKRKYNFKLYTIIMYSFTYQDYGAIEKISDMLLDIREKDLGSWNEKVNKKLFSAI